MDNYNKIVPRHALADLADILHKIGKTIVTTNGCFDILHVGHARALKQARELGGPDGKLIVGLNSDESVRRLKGSERPINSELDRAELLAALECVSYVTIFGEDTPVEFLQLVRPHFHAKSADYTPEKLAETPVVQNNGGQVVILPLVAGKSTTGLVDKLRKL